MLIAKGFLTEEVQSEKYLVSPHLIIKFVPKIFDFS